jgi:hypothetical protein
MTMKCFSFVLVAVIVASTSANPSKSRKQHYTAALDEIIAINRNLGDYDNDGKTEIFEGDIIMTPKLKMDIARSENVLNNADSIANDAIDNGAWPHGEVPYTFAPGFGYGADVKLAIAEFHAKTCIRFRPRISSDKDYVQFVHDGGCWSYIGRIVGMQKISLGVGCDSKGIAIHEMMHALGFYHEQSRRDRDSYITVVFENIQKAMWYNFEKYDHGDASTLGEAYDKKSIMHYGNYAFSTNGKMTIVSNSNQNEDLGQRTGLSQIDVNQLNKYYKCDSTKVTTKGPVTQTPQPETTTTAETIVETTTPAGCHDKYACCSKMVTKEVKLCTESAWVRDNCEKSCKKCTNCKDDDISCEAWASPNAFCSEGCCNHTEHGDYMMKSCKKSCGVC